MCMVEANKVSMVSTLNSEAREPVGLECRLLLRLIVYLYWCSFWTSFIFKSNIVCQTNMNKGWILESTQFDAKVHFHYSSWWEFGEDVVNMFHYRSNGSFTMKNCLQQTTEHYFPRIPSTSYSFLWQVLSLNEMKPFAFAIRVELCCHVNIFFSEQKLWTSEVILSWFSRSWVGSIFIFQNYKKKVSKKDSVSLMNRPEMRMFESYWMSKWTSRDYDVACPTEGKTFKI